MRKFSDNDIKNIRVKYKETKITYKELADEYGEVSKTLIMYIVKGKSYKNSPGPILGEDYYETDEKKNKSYIQISDEKVLEIRYKMANERINSKDIESDYETSAEYIKQIVRGQVRKEVGGPISGEDYYKSFSGKLFGRDIVKMCKKHSKGEWTIEDIVDKYDIKEKQVRRIIKGLCHKDVDRLIKGKDY